jgi:Rap guanine nucleotide exchange factor 4
MCAAAVLDPPSPKNNDSQIRSYIGCFRVIDCQKTLNAMAKKIELR